MVVVQTFVLLHYQHTPPPLAPRRMSGKHSYDISRNRVKNFILLPFQKCWCIVVLRKMPEVTVSLFYLKGCFC